MGQQVDGQDGSHLIMVNNIADFSKIFEIIR